MARLLAPPLFTGTVGNVTIYRMHGHYFIRSRSSLTSRRVKKDPAFRVTMQYAALLAKASRIASQVYAALPQPRKKHRPYRTLTGEAMTWLKHTWEEQDVIDYLTKRYVGKAPTITWPAMTLKRSVPLLLPGTPKFEEEKKRLSLFFALYASPFRPPIINSKSKTLSFR